MKAAQIATIVQEIHASKVFVNLDDGRINIIAVTKTPVRKFVGTAEELVKEMEVIGFHYDGLQNGVGMTVGIAIFHRLMPFESYPSKS